MPMPLAQDPDELFDVVSPDGSPTGIVKRRADVHRDGDWHCAIHVWVYGIDADGPFLLLNQRGRAKDTRPLAVDPTVGGHLAAGESVEQAYREIEEEIGIAVNPQSLVYVGRRRRDSDGGKPGVIDREIQKVFLLRDDRPLGAYRPNAAELEGLILLRLDEAIRFFAGDTTGISGRRYRAADGIIEAIDLKPADLQLPPGDTYFLDLAHVIFDRLGEDPAAVLPADDIS